MNTDESSPIHRFVLHTIIIPAPLVGVEFVISRQARYRLLPQTKQLKELSIDDCVDCATVAAR